ncbi:MAG: carboxypeptidase regulatory-like domain-containing protein, partial [Planctomycetota bacterium]|nr:carboxypeptidase regulatory-like domain-containing protein [Planctomycetota bacterium]
MVAVRAVPAPAGEPAGHAAMLAEFHKLRGKDPAKATAMAERLLSAPLQARDANEVRSYLGSQYLRRGDAARAAEAFGGIVPGTPQETFVKEKGEALVLFLKDPDAGAVAVERAFAKGAAAARVSDLLDRARVYASSPRPEHREAAVKFYGEIAAKHPAGRMEALWGIAETLERGGRKEDVARLAECYGRIAREAADAAARDRAAFLRAAALERSGDRAAARGAYEEHLRTFPDGENAAVSLERLGEIARAMDGAAAACALLRKFAADHPKSPCAGKARLLAIQQFAKAGDFEAAMRELAKEEGNLGPEAARFLATLGGIRGVVLDEAGRPLAGAEVKLAARREGKEGLSESLARTDGAGAYAFQRIPAGRYEFLLLTRRPGPPVLLASDFAVEEGKISSFDADLRRVDGTAQFRAFVRMGMREAAVVWGRKLTGEGRLSGAEGNSVRFELARLAASPQEKTEVLQGIRPETAAEGTRLCVELAAAQAAAGMPDLAIGTAERAFAEYAPAMTADDWLSLASGFAAGRSAAELDRGLEFLRQGMERFPEKRGAFLLAMAANYEAPASPAARRALALDCYDGLLRSVHATPDRVAALRAKARHLAEIRGQPREAAEVLRSLASSYPVSPETGAVLEKMADLARAADGHEAAAKMLREFAGKYPASPHARRCLEEALNQYIKARDYNGAAREHAEWKDRLPEKCGAYLASLGSLAGTATDIDGHPAPGAKVRLALPGGAGILETTAGGNGGFRFANLPAGRYGFVEIIPPPSSKNPMPYFALLDLTLAGGAELTVRCPPPPRYPSPPPPAPLEAPDFSDGRDRSKCAFLAIRETTGA